MKFLHGFSKSQAAESTPAQAVSDSGSLEAATLREDEITDAALLEAIVGTGDPGSQNGDTSNSRTSKPKVLIGRLHHHKHR